MGLRSIKIGSEVFVQGKTANIYINVREIRRLSKVDNLLHVYVGNASETQTFNLNQEDSKKSLIEILQELARDVQMQEAASAQN